MIFHVCVFLFSQDVFVPTQSQEAPQQSDKKMASLPGETQSQQLESAAFTLPLQLSVNTQSSSPAQKTSEHIEEDSQATQIEELEEPPGVNTSDSVVSHQRRESNGVSSESQTATSSKASASAESPRHRSECAKKEATNLSQQSDVHKKTPLNVQDVNVKDSKSDREEASSADAVSCLQPKFDPSDLTVNSCVQETPPDTTPCSLSSQSMISNTSAVDVVKGSVDLRKEGGTAKSPSVKSLSQKCGTVGNSQTVKHVMDEPVQGEVEEEVVMEEGESTLGGGASGMALALSQSQLLSPEPAEGESSNRGEDSVVVVTDSERDSQVLQKDVSSQSETNSSQPIGGNVSVSTNGHESQAQAKKVHPAPDRLSQTERVGPEPEGLKDKSLSDSSGGKMGSDIPYVTVSKV